MDEHIDHDSEIEPHEPARDDRAFVAIRFTPEQQGFLKQVGERLQVTEADVVRMLVDGYRVYAAMFPVTPVTGVATSKKARREGVTSRTDRRLIWLALAFLLGVVLAAVYLVVKGPK